MVETHEVVLEVERTPGHWIAAARWPHSRDACAVAAWAAALTGGRAVLRVVKEWLF